MAAIIGLIGLFFYTRYTRRMMHMQESAARATITPKLVAQSDVEFVPTHLEHNDATDIGLQEPNIVLLSAIFRFRNIGAGAALFLKGWHQPVSDNFVADNSDILAKTDQVNESSPQLTELMTGEATSVTFTGFRPEDLHRRWLFVVNTIDQTNLKHQLQLLRTPKTNGTTEVSVSMVHQKDGKGGVKS